MKIKIGRFSRSRAKQYVWIRLGDLAEYDKFLNPYDAGINVGSSLPVAVKFSNLSFDYKTSGVVIPRYFTGQEYISLFWGDEDAQWIRDLITSEKRMFEQGVREGLK